MPRLLLLRHAEAEPARAGSGDHARPLSQRGRHQAEEIGKILARRGTKIDRALCSTALRTRQTLDALAAALGGSLPTLFDEGLYDPESDYVAFIRAHGGYAECLLVLGHNPAMQVTALRIDNGPASAKGGALSRGFPPGGLAIFDGPLPWQELGKQSMRLCEFLGPGGGGPSARL
jgi:phosphohistidine phosphatase